MLMKNIADALSARLVGDGTIDIARLVHPSAAERPSDLAVAMTAETVAALSDTKAQAVVVSAKRASAADRFKSVIVIEQMRTALAMLTRLFDPGPSRFEGIHPTAIVAPDATLGEGASIGPYTVIGPRSRIGARTSILSNVSIGADVAIGEHGLIYSGVCIGDRVEIGRRAIIHFNAVIGSDGFSFAPELGPRMPYPPDLTVLRVHSLGNVIIGDDVEIGAATTIDRSTLDATRIGSGTKIDNHVHIGHNVTIGERCLIAGMVGIAGSTKIGDRVRIGGGAGISDHITIGTEAIVGAGSGLMSNVADGVFVVGSPAITYHRMVDQVLYLGRQKMLHAKVDDLKSRLEALERSSKT